MHDAVSYRTAVETLESALLTGTATAHTPLRTHTELPDGHLLYMPSLVDDYLGVKLASVSPGNPARGMPRIQGLMMLYDGATHEPRAILDAEGLTVLRTAALSALAVRHLTPEDASHLVVFGSGPQARGHVEAIRAVRPLTKVTVVARSLEPGQALVERIRASGLSAELGAASRVADADVIACCTSTSTPLFDSSLVGNSATVVAMGSHSPEAREVDTALVRRASVIVETRASAFAEAGDVILAYRDGVPHDEAIDGELADILDGGFLQTSRPRLFKGVGEAWADVAVAVEAAKALGILERSASNAVAG
ncbi:ornithine cyclodeaminase family protein [Brevibacterium yomogidense]|uniref:ornithine cyclodeaminase family protein n=1 Tax=Brevibacterium yomogidense TaxID=946573 RepID=UPI0018DFECB2